MPEAQDPTTNVKESIRAEIKRLEDVFSAEVKRIDEKMELQSGASILLNVAEAKRIDAIRAVDVNAVSVANEKATAQAVVLASQVSASAETLRALVAATATTQAQQLATLTTQLTDRLSSLEKSQYENKGSTGGAKDMWGYVVGVVGFLIAIGAFLIPLLK